MEAASHQTDSTESSHVLSVVMPVYNETATLESAVQRVLSTPIAHELIVVDDGSTDGTREVLQRLAGLPRVEAVFHERNRGKGAALKTGFARANGSIVIVQDADLEYDPADIPALVEPILEGRADVVYGSRFLEAGKNLDGMARGNYWGNRLITWLFNRLNGQHLTDVETCYKAMRRDVLRQIEPWLEEDRFGIEIELSARLVRISGLRVVERPIRYVPRRHWEGKKIRWQDGARALWCVWHFRK